MTVTFGPIRTNFEQPLVCDRGVLVPLAIAENPRGDVRHLFAFGLEVERRVRTFDGVIAVCAVQQNFAEPTIVERQFILPDFATHEITAAGLNEIGGDAPIPGIPNRGFTNFIEFRHSKAVLRASEFGSSPVKLRIR